MSYDPRGPNGARRDAGLPEYHAGQWEKVGENETTEAWECAGQVTRVEAIVQLRPSFWRHPVLWWKTRHLLPDLLQAEQDFNDLVGAEYAKKFRELEEIAILYGVDSDEFKKARERLNGGKRQS